MSALVLLPLAVWLALWNVIGVYTFGYGPLIFACLAGVSVMVFVLGLISVSTDVLSPSGVGDVPMGAGLFGILFDLN